MHSYTQKRLISLTEATVRYGISRQTIYRFVNRGELALIKIGRASRLDLEKTDQLFGVSLLTQEDLSWPK